MHFIAFLLQIKLKRAYKIQFVLYQEDPGAVLRFAVQVTPLLLSI
jgi:hypothetical protein